MGNRMGKERQQHLHEEVKFWKRELDKAVHEKTWYLSKYAETHRQLKIALAQVRMLQQQQQQAQQQAMQQVTESVSSITVSPRPDRHQTNSMGSAINEHLASPLGVRMLQIQLSSSQSRLKDADTALAKAEERAASLMQELTNIKAELECARSTTAAYSSEADLLRSQLVMARGLGDDTAGQAAWLAQQLQEAQRAAEKLRADSKMKDDMMDLLRMQLADYTSDTRCGNMTTLSSSAVTPLASRPPLDLLQIMDELSHPPPLPDASQSYPYGMTGGTCGGAAVPVTEGVDGRDAVGAGAGGGLGRLSNTEVLLLHHNMAYDESGRTSWALSSHRSGAGDGSGRGRGMVPMGAAVAGVVGGAHEQDGRVGGVTGLEPQTPVSARRTWGEGVGGGAGSNYHPGGVLLSWSPFQVDAVGRDVWEGEEEETGEQGEGRGAWPRISAEDLFLGVELGGEGAEKRDDCCENGLGGTHVREDEGMEPTDSLPRRDVRATFGNQTDQAAAAEVTTAGCGRVSMSQAASKAPVRGPTPVAAAPNPFATCGHVYTDSARTRSPAPSGIPRPPGVGLRPIRTSNVSAADKVDKADATPTLTPDPDDDPETFKVSNIIARFQTDKGSTPTSVGSGGGLSRTSSFTGTMSAAPAGSAVAVLKPMVHPVARTGSSGVTHRGHWREGAASGAQGVATVPTSATQVA